MVRRTGAPEGAQAFAYQRREMYRLFAAAFIELDTGDALFLQSLSQQIFGAASRMTLTIPHFWALVHLEPIEGRTMTELARLLIRDKGTVTTIVDKLEAYGWVTRLRGKAGDRRYWRVVLTPEGRMLRERVVPAHDAWVSVRFADLTAAQLSQLASLLQALRPGLRADPERAAQVALHAKRPAARASG